MFLSSVSRLRAEILLIQIGPGRNLEDMHPGLGVLFHILSIDIHGLDLTISTCDGLEIG